ncbi:MAG: type IV secretory system conjugative DNA transfer family protein [Clostridiales bacterium]|nr:type IV secretory system conjugative DNA transfer family protein [Clostridiales bacterium]
MGIRKQLKDMDVNISGKCRQIEELKLECSRSNRGASVLSDTIFVSRDHAQTRRNNNTLVFDNKEHNFDMVLENLKDDNSNYVIVDFDGVYYEKTAADFRARGYAIKSINLIDIEKSDGYNPFAYIRNEVDVDIIVQCIIDNTNSDYYLKASGNDRILIKNLEQKFLKTLLSSYMKYGTSKTLTAAVNLLASEDREDKLERLFSGQFSQGPNEMECRRFQIFKRDADSRYSDIIQSCYERIVFFKDERLVALTKKESLNFQHLYLAKEVLYIIIPSNLRQVEMFTSMILSQICYILCNETRRNNTDRMVMLYLNYFSDTGAIVNFERMLPEFHHYNVGSMLHINNFVGAGKIYQKWKELFDSCDSIVYLGVNDEPTQQYVLEHADSVIIRKTKMMGRDMYKISAIKAEEIKSLGENECIVVIKGMGTFLSTRCGATIIE